MHWYAPDASAGRRLQRFEMTAWCRAHDLGAGLRRRWHHNDIASRGAAVSADRTASFRSDHRTGNSDMQNAESNPGQAQQTK
jgi:hypothetical protein